MIHIEKVWLHAHRMIRSARHIINENLQPLGLSSAEGNILIHLLTQGREMGQEQLVKQLDISKPAVSRALDSLERKGYIVRQPNPNDKRAHLLILTAQAEVIAPAVEQAYNKVYSQALRGISQEELEGFLNLFSRISKNFE